VKSKPFLMKKAIVQNITSSQVIWLEKIEKLLARFSLSEKLQKAEHFLGIFRSFSD
jgi:hypothetical protein